MAIGPRTSNAASGIPNVARSMPAVRGFMNGETPSFEYPYSGRGITKDSAGAALANAIVTLYRTADNSLVHQTTSDAIGNYVIPASNLIDQYVVVYKAGSPDVAGTSVNTLRGT